MQPVRQGLHRKLLDDILEKRMIADRWSEEARDEAVKEWHNLPGWADSAEGLQRLRKKFVVWVRGRKASKPIVDCIAAARLSQTATRLSWFICPRLIRRPWSGISSSAAIRWAPTSLIQRCIRRLSGSQDASLSRWRW